MSADQEMPANFGDSRVEAIIDQGDLSREEQEQKRVGLGSNIYSLSGTIETMNEPVDSEANASSAQYQPLAEVTAALNPDEPNIEEPNIEELSMELSSRVSTSSDDSCYFASSEDLKLLDRAMITNGVNGLGAMSGTLMFTGIKTLIKIQNDRKHLPLPIVSY